MATSTHPFPFLWSTSQNEASTKETALSATGVVQQYIENHLDDEDLRNAPQAVMERFALTPETHSHWSFKRALDILCIVLCLPFLLPLFSLIAFAIKLESPKGSIFFQQERMGHLGKTFYMLKFRTMVEDAEDRLAELQKQNETNAYMFKMKHDPRVTRVGRFLRKFSLDELPQLINVLRGEMSLVGPRPPLMREVAQYAPWHHVRFSALPGLTGMWQVSGRSSIQNFDEVVFLDFRYILGWHLGRDLMILLKTIPVFVFGKDTA